MTISRSTVEGYLESAITSMGTGDWTSAMNSLLQAETALIGLPDSEHGQAKMQWRTDIESLKKSVRDRENTAANTNQGTFQITKLDIIRPTS